MNLVFRSLLINFLSAFYFTAKSKLIVSTGGFFLFSNLIYRLYKQWEARILALTLLKISANSSYLNRIVNRSTELFIILAALLIRLVDKVQNRKWSSFSSILLRYIIKYKYSFFKR